MQIIPLAEGTFTIDKTKIFIPFNINEDELQSRSTGSLLVEIQPFIVITQKDILLLDTGLGFSKKGELQIYSNLKKNNIQPEQITKVLLTHLHKDHAGGISKKDESNNSQLSFPNAKYYVQKKGLEFAFEKSFPSFIVDEISILQNNPQVIFLNGNGLIDETISYEVTGAHSPYHQVYWIKENNQTIFFGGDDAPQLQQMKNKFVAKYDFDGKKAMQLRQQWWKEGKEKDWTFLFYHDIKTAVYNF
ncbi:MAG: MBL fold metallo-hydrolase [Chitinophagaceae bacterium]